MSGDSSWRFTGHLANLEYYYESVDDPDAWKVCPPSIKGTYMQNFKNLWDLYISNSAVAPSTLAAGGYDAQAEFGKEQAVFYQNGSWEWAALTGTGDGQYGLDNLSMIPFYCGVAGEEKAGLNCGTENCWAVNAKASAEDIQATLDFMYWLVTDAEVSRMLVDEFAVMPYKQAAESTCGFLADANAYAAEGNYVMPWVTNFQPNVDAYREAIVAAMNQYDNDPTDANWEQVKTAGVKFVIIRIGYRGYGSGALVLDPMFEQHFTNARNAGLKVGVYFFSQAVNENEAREEAQGCAYVLNGRKLDYPIYFDTEASGGKNGRADGLGVEDRTKCAIAFCEEVKAQGYQPGVYASTLWFRKRIDLNRLKSYSIWNAHYNVAGSPIACDMWQGTCTARIPGYGGQIDVNISYVG